MRIAELERIVSQRDEELKKYSEQRVEDEKLINNLKAQLLQPDNKMTVESYKQVLMEDAFDASCISKLADEIENARALPFIKKVDFHNIPSEIQKPRKNIVCGMAGCFRHKKMFN